MDLLIVYGYQYFLVFQYDYKDIRYLININAAICTFIVFCAYFLLKNY